MPDYKAIVVPTNQLWPLDGTARVTPEPPFPDTSTRVLPLEHRIVAGDFTIRRMDYPLGVVILPVGSPVSGDSAEFPLLASSGDEIPYDYPGFQATPDGIVFWFTS